MNIIVVPNKFKCPICRMDFKDKSAGEACLLEHRTKFRNESPVYSIGKKVLAHKYNDSNNNKVSAKIIKIDGFFVNRKLLVEDEDLERWWVPTVKYQQSQNPNFQFVELIKEEIGPDGCRCKKEEGLRSTHCPMHGSCTCCHGATCPMCDEDERFVPERGI